jgi:hypothetical protein
MCDGCSFEVRLYSCLDSYSLYELPDGGHVPIPIRAEWCFQCKTLRATENLPDIASTSQRVRRAKRALWRCAAGCFSLSSRRRQMLAEFKLSAQENLESAERFHRVVSNRKSPPRCLSCGSFDHKELPLSDFPRGKRITLPIRHPGCDGNFVIDDRCPIMADVQGPGEYFTPEGIFLRSTFDLPRGDPTPT